MRRKGLLLSATITLLLSLAAMAPAAAAAQSCVGWFASTSAQADGREFAAGINEGAHFAQPFGRNVVAPFTRVALEDCQG